MILTLENYILRLNQKNLEPKELDILFVIFLNDSNSCIFFLIWFFASLLICTQRVHFNIMRITTFFCGQDFHEEAEEELPKKAKYFFGTAVQMWDAEFYVKVDDNVDLRLGKFWILLLCTLA